MDPSSATIPRIAIPGRRRPFALLAFGLPLLALLVLVLTVVVWAEPKPTATPGPEADAMAAAMMEAIDHQAWLGTGAVRWSFRGNRHHLWDRQRQLARVRWDKVEVLLDLATGDGRAWKAGREVEGQKAEKLIREAYEAWVNDSFWLNPISKLLDQGTVRGLVPQEDGQRGLLVEFTSGGITPGDAYLWLVGDNNLPVAWRMWTSNIPIGGARASWEGWLELGTGVKVATLHDLPIGKIEMVGVAAAATLAELESGEDPFAALFAK